MKIYSTHQNRNVRVSNTMKPYPIEASERNRTNEEFIIRNENKIRQSREEQTDSWGQLVARRMQMLRERLTNFFLPETIE